ncbi:hypothetical protein [Streptomyces sp. NBC_01431]|nr:hypothetical protein [Streptomyces sp. NBC_01431]
MPQSTSEARHIRLREILLSAAVRGLASGIVRFLLDRLHELL